MPEPESYIAMKECGCLAIAIVNSPEHKRDIARAIAEGIREGYTFRLVPTQQVREMPWTCDAHKKQPRPKQPQLMKEAPGAKA